MNGCQMLGLVSRRFTAALIVCLAIWQLGCAPAGVDSRAASESNSVVKHEKVLELLTSEEPGPICWDIRRDWHPGTLVMLLEIVRFNQNPQTGAEVLKLMQDQTRQDFQLDMNKWFQWIWKTPLSAPSRVRRIQTQDLHARRPPLRRIFYNDGERGNSTG